MNPLVSVVISTYNRPYELGELIESLNRQTFRDFEIIIVNDAGRSVDFVSDLYPELAIRVIHQDINRQLVHAKNAGVESARGRYIMLCDDDDLLLPVHMEKMLQNLQGFDLVYCDTEIFSYQWVNHVRIPLEWSLFAFDNDYKSMRRFSTFMSSGSLYPKELHKEIGLFDPLIEPYWDWDFYLRVAQNHRIGKVPIATVLYAFTENGNNMSGNLARARQFLNRLSAKHQLGDLPTANFKSLLSEETLQSRRTSSLRLWKGEPFRSRLVDNPQYLE